MAKLLNWVDVTQALKGKGIQIFSPLDLQRLFSASKVAVQFFLHRNAKRGRLTRLKKSQHGSLYAVADNSPSVYLIANGLYKPSYISVDSALSFYHMIPETIYTVTSITPQSTREFQTAGIVYRYFRIKKECFTGYQPLPHENATIWIAEPEKALADYLYFVALKKRQLQYERLDVRNLHLQKLKNYIKLFSKPKMLELMEQIYDHAGKP